MCQEETSRNKQSFCSNSCKIEYHLNKKLQQSAKNILQVLVEERNEGMLPIELNSSVYSLAYQRKVPLVQVVVKYKDHVAIRLTEEGKRWYDYHFKSANSS